MPGLHVESKTSHTKQKSSLYTFPIALRSYSVNIGSLLYAFVSSRLEYCNKSSVGPGAEATGEQHYKHTARSTLTKAVSSHS